MAVRKDLSSLTGLCRLANPLPSHEWPGYFHFNFVGAESLVLRPPSAPVALSRRLNPSRPGLDATIPVRRAQRAVPTRGSPSRLSRRSGVSGQRASVLERAAALRRFSRIRGGASAEAAKISAYFPMSALCRNAATPTPRLVPPETSAARPELPGGWRRRLHPPMIGSVDYVFCN